MTDENKFFRYVWRFNAIVLACLAIVAGGAMLYSALNPWRPEPPAGHFAPVPRDAENQFTYRLQSHGEHRLVGREQLVALGRWNGSPETYGLAEMRTSSSYMLQSRSVNLLAVNQDTVESHWIFKGYNRAVLADDLVYDAVPSPVPQASDRSASSAVALVMTAVEADTNKDGELTEKDRQSFYVYRSGTQEAVRLLTADLIVSREQTGKDRYLVIYENGSSAVAATFSVPDFKLLAEKPLPKVPNG